MAEEVALFIELENRWRRRATLRRGRRGGGMLFAGFKRSRPMDDPNVILGIHGDADGLPHDPMIGQRLGPHRVHFEPRSLHPGRLHHRPSCQSVRPHSECGKSREKCGANAEIAFHDEFIIVI